MTTKEPPKIHYITHNFSDFDSETKHMTRNQRAIYLDLRTLYFTTAHKNNGAIGDDLALLYFRLDCHSDSDKADVDWLLKDKFKKLGKTYRHADWDKQIKDIRFAMRHASNADTKGNAKSNDSNGSDVTPSNIKSNDERNANIYDNTGGFVMTGAERTEKSRKLKALKNKGIQADKSMTLDDIRGLYDTHFNPCNAGSNATDVIPCNADSNEVCNGSNAQNAENNPLPITHELKEKNECVNSEMLHAPTHTNFSKNLKTIGEWQAPSVDIINGLLSGAGFGRTLSQDEYGQIFTKFKNYNVSRELQGNFLATEQVRIDKLVDWIKREKPIFNAPTPADDDFGGVWTDDSNKLSKPKPNTFNISGKWVKCFDGYNSMECIAIVKEYRLAGETSLEAYKRIKRAGVANCQKPQTASPEFVSHILSKHNRPQQAKQVAR
ncbi:MULTISPECIES: DUF1376 domain-containing protein [unclassified Moraxella]|uniref:DUF1376 domain-containing protein n=1 Tax=unclassified Moraxella TaxID=2685852 RepID=UPI00359E5C8C